MLAVALYARVSTDNGQQDTKNQLLQLRDFAKQQGWNIVREFVDNASAKSGDRAAFKAMFDAAQKGEFELLFFWSLDRLTREGVLPTLQYLQRLSDAGVKFKSFTEQYIDSLGVFGPAIVGILAAIAHQERLRISERTRAGLARAKANGVKLGRKRKQIDMSIVHALQKQNRSLRSIAKELAVSPSLLSKLAKEACV